MITADYHTHTAFSTDSTASPEQMIQQAVALGLKTYCITDHMDYLFPGDEQSFIFDPALYLKELSDLRSRYRDRIDLRIGIELGLRDEPNVRDSVSERIQNLLKQYSFDYVIGSTHIVDGMDPYEAAYWEKYTVSDGIRRYFESVFYSICHYDGFQTYGHLDYVLRYVPKGSTVDMSEYSDLIDRILREIIARGIVLEVNTSRLARGEAETNPSRAILSRYRELGGNKIAIGSDAHAPNAIAGGFQETERRLKELGFTHYCIFRKQKASLRRL